jgi:hypothetical protein
MRSRVEIKWEGINSHWIENAENSPSPLYISAQHFILTGKCTRNTLR